MKSTNSADEKAGVQPGSFDNTSNVKFSGTQNPRHLRAILHLMMAMGGDVRRERIDQIAGASNGPELIAELRRRGLHLPCDRLHAVDRDGRPCRPGVYWLTASDFNKLGDWIEANPLFSATDGERP